MRKYPEFQDDAVCVFVRVLLAIRGANLHVHVHVLLEMARLKSVCSLSQSHHGGLSVCCANWTKLVKGNCGGLCLHST